MVYFGIYNYYEIKIKLNEHIKTLTLYKFLTAKRKWL